MRELECNGALLTMAFIGAGVPMPVFELELQDDRFNIHRDIN